MPSTQRAPRRLIRSAIELKELDAPLEVEPVLIALLSADPEFGALIPPAERALADRAAMVPGYRLPAGARQPDGLLAAHPEARSLLIVQGLITQNVGLAGSVSSQLRAPGQLLHPKPRVGGTLHAPTACTVSPPGATVAVLGDAYHLLERSWPQLGVALRERLIKQTEDDAIRVVIGTLPRVETRVLALLWQMAERWGTVGHRGVTVHLKLTHAMIGKLVGSKRPTISLALSRLIGDGHIRATDHGGWLLDLGSRGLLDGDVKGTLSAASVVALDGHR